MSKPIETEIEDLKKQILLLTTSISQLEDVIHQYSMRETIAKVTMDAQLEEMDEAKKRISELENKRGVTLNEFKGLEGR